MDIVFATNNPHKLKEIASILGPPFSLSGLKELNIKEDIPEDFATLEENASQKAWYIYTKYKRNCFADDTGLEVVALDGAPGVYSARYSRLGTPVYTHLDIAAANIRKLLDTMDGISDRRARFRTVISLVMDGAEHCFEGIVNGHITLSASGKEGFGYDPVFQPDGFDLTFAEMDLQQKNSISHRARAVAKLVDFLKGLK